MYPCTKCGLCCKNLRANNIYSNLDRGDGTCIHFNELENLCGIYENRPIICRIEDAHKVFFHNIPFNNYINENIQSCIELQKTLD